MPLTTSDHGICVSSYIAEKCPVMFFTVCFRAQQSFNDREVRGSNQPAAVVRDPTPASGSIAAVVPKPCISGSNAVCERKKTAAFEKAAVIFDSLPRELTAARVRSQLMDRKRTQQHRQNNQRPL